MNFLAHLYLTNNQLEKVVVGNFIADAVKGNKAVKKYELPIQKGIRIHRAIDDFTDKHPLFRQGTRRLHKNYGKFSPIILDIVYDHLLAVNWNRYSTLPLQAFANWQYALIERHFAFLPQRTRMWYDYMKENNLLFEYSNVESVELVLHRMDFRTGGISGMGNAMDDVRTHRSVFTEEFHEFFEDMRKHIKPYLK